MLRLLKGEIISINWKLQHVTIFVLMLGFMLFIAYIEADEILNLKNQALFTKKSRIETDSYL